MDIKEGVSRVILPVEEPEKQELSEWGVKAVASADKILKDAAKTNQLVNLTFASKRLLNTLRYTKQKVKDPEKALAVARHKTYQFQSPGGTASIKNSRTRVRQQARGTVD